MRLLRQIGLRDLRSSDLATRTPHDLLGADWGLVAPALGRFGGDLPVGALKVLGQTKTITETRESVHHDCIRCGQTVKKSF
jgi:hypothetical protein